MLFFPYFLINAGNAHLLANVGYLINARNDDLLANIRYIYRYNQPKVVATETKDHLLNYFRGKRYILKEDLFKFFRQENPGVTDNALRVRILYLRRAGVLTKVGSDVYSLEFLPVWRGKYNPQQQKLIKLISTQYRDIKMILWSTLWLNEFTNQQSFKEIILIEVEGWLMQGVFNLVRNELGGAVFINPTPKEQQFYITGEQQSVVVRKLITKSPILKPRKWGRNKSVDISDNLPTPKLEKVLVDIHFDQDLFQAWQSDTETIWQTAFERYAIDFSVLINYADRRGVKERTREFAESTLKIRMHDIL